VNQDILNRAFNDFQSLRILVVGDVMIDSYYWGKSDRISPEAPVPVVSVSKYEHRLGGAANVALNLKAMGAEAILCGIVGSDNKGDLLKELLQQSNLSSEGVVHVSNRPTTVKTRIISGNQQMLRVDEEDTHPLNSNESALFFERISNIINNKKCDAIIFEDYDKGAITPQLIEKVVALAKNKDIPTCVDPKKRQFLDYKNVSLFKPNLKELKEGLKIDISQINLNNLDEAAKALRLQMPVDVILITLSEHGVYFNNGSQSKLIPAHLRNIADVSGAGDTVISVATLCMALKLDTELMAALANLSGGLVCEHVGVVPIDAQKLKSEALRLSK
jgi:D-glycero-beta-D-manno-heptose-7-phosphate kinase